MTAQPALPFVHFTTADGLPGNHISSVETDPEGFVWVGTDNGLARFDGQQFMPFEVLRPHTQLPKGRLVIVMADSSNALWVRSEAVLYRINLITFQVGSYRQEVNSGCVDGQGRCWFGTPNGLALFCAGPDSFQIFPLNNQGKAGIAPQVCKGRGDELLLNTGAGIVRFDTRAARYVLPNSPPDITKNVLNIAADADGMLWMTSWYNKQSGFIQYDPYREVILRSFGCDEWGITNTDLNDICPRKDFVWMATNFGGLCRYDLQRNRFDCFPIDPSNPGNIGYGQLTCVKTDRFGNLWVGTPFMLYWAPVRLKTTELLAHDPFHANSLVAWPASVIFPVTDTILAFGTWSGLSLYDRIKKTFFNIHLPQYNDNKYNDQVVSFAPGADGTLWLSTWSGLFRLNIHTGSILEYYITHINAGANHPDAVKRLYIGAIRRLYRDRTGMIWMTNFDNQLRRFSDQLTPRQFEYLPVLTADKHAPNNRVECFLDLDDRYLLLGTFDGLVRYDRTTNTFAAVPTAFPGIDGPAKVGSLARANNGDVLLVANGRPFRVRLSENKGDAAPVTASFPLTDCQHILADHSGTIWVTTDNGLGQIDQEADFFYASRYYLNDNVFSVRPRVAPVMDHAGNLYLGGSRGVSVLHTAQFKAPKGSPPPVRIVMLKINDQPLELDTAIHRKTVLTLQYYQNNPSFEFSVLGSSIPALNHFAYRLNTEEWVDLGTKNTINFSNLPPGNYTLRVKAADSDGIWNETGTVLRLVVRPPWWRSWAAWLVYTLLCAGAVVAYYRFQLRQRLALREAEQLRELDAFKSRFFTNITHEFRTPLTVILGVSEQLQELSAGAEQVPKSALVKQVGLIRRNGENLLRLINQILDLAKLESNALKINYVQGDVLSYLRYVAESLHSLANAQNVLVQVESEEAAVVMDFDPERLLQIVHNLLSNAIKFTPSGGRVRVRLTLADGPAAAIVVTDTGAGISAEELPHIFDRFFQGKNQAEAARVLAGSGGSGIGLSLTRELVRAMGGTISVESTPGQGTSFTVRLPIRNSAPLISAGWPDRPGTASLSLPATAELLLPESRPTTLPLLLLIEDNPDVVEYLSAFLNAYYRLEFAYNGRAGIEKALEVVPDVILSDVMMPERDGLEVCDFLKNDERTSHVPIVLLTAKATLDDRIAGLRRGADAYLAKPFHREELLVTLENLLRSRQQLQTALRRGLEPVATGSATPAPPDVDVFAIENAFVQKLRQYVEDRIDQADLSMDDLCRAMTMSYPNLHRKLSALTNLSPLQFVRLLRLQRARDLLLGTGKSIGEIAFEVGFNDPKYFSRVFTEAYGQPPSALRESSTS